MKTRLIKSVLALLLTFLALPMMGQDFMTVHFKNGTARVFHFSNIEAISVSKEDADGMIHGDYQYQHITTYNKEFVYNLDIIDSISFTKYNAESAREDFSSALNVALSNLANCETTSDLDKKLEIINNADAVEKVWTEGSYVRIKPKNCQPFTIDIDKSKTMSRIGSPAFGRRMSELVQSTEKSDIEVQNGEKLKMVIANQMNNDMFYWWQDNITNHLSPLKEKLEKAGISVKYVPMPDLEFFRSEMFDYDVVFLCTHGGYFSEKEQHALLTGQSLGEVLITEDNENGIEKSVFQDNYDALFTDERYKDAIDDMEIFIHAETRNDGVDDSFYWVAYPMIYESFIENRAIGSFENPNSIIFMASCLTLNSNNSLANIFFNKRGLNTYLGYNESTSFCQEAGSRFFVSYFNGASAWKAYNDLGDVPVSVETSSMLVTGSCKEERVTNKAFWSLFNTHYTAELTMLSKDKKDKDFLQFFLLKTNTEETDEASAKEFYNREKAVYISGTIMAIDPKEVVKGFKYGTDKLLKENKKADYTVRIQDIGKGNYRIQAKLTDIEPGITYYYRAYTYDGHTYNYGDICSFTIETPTDIPAEAIDLGLPSGTLWASYNIGATKPEEYGDYFSWGETEVRDKYYFTTYSLCDGTVTSCHDIGENISGTKYDVAHVKWGNGWCMPTKDDFRELVYNCDYKETTLNGVKGFQFTGSNGKYIFLPYTGYCWDTENSKAGTEGSYWSATQTTSVNKAHEMSFRNDRMLWDCYINRFAGLTVRPVKR